MPKRIASLLLTLFAVRRRESPSPRASRRRHTRLRRREPQERARRSRRRLLQVDRQDGHRQLCRKLRARQADRAGRARRHLLLRQRRLDGSSRQPPMQSSAQSRVTLLGNDIVLIAPAASDVELDHRPELSARRGARRRQARDGADRVRAGRQIRQGLAQIARRMGQRRRPNVAEAENVRAALALVSRGEAPLGIVYATDAKADPGVKVVGVFPEDSHPPILYPVALIATAKPDARAFLDYLTSPAARPRFEEQGFRVGRAWFLRRRFETACTSRRPSSSRSSSVSASPSSRR